MHGNRGGQPRGWVYVSPGRFRSDLASEGAWLDRDLRATAIVPGQELTYTAVPRGGGTRLGVDRDADGWLDVDEADAGSDPTDRQRTPVDRDGDGAANDVDCAPDLAGAYGLPREVSGLRLVQDKLNSLTTLAWDSQSASAGPGTTSDIASGVLGELRADRGFARGTCLVSGGEGTSWVDARGNPSPRQGFYYLVRARNACAVGSYGNRSGGTPRDLSACP